MFIVGDTDAIYWSVNETKKITSGVLPETNETLSKSC